MFVAATAIAAAQKPKSAHPDLQGIWSRSTLTPLERPKAMGDKAFVPEDEVAGYQKYLLAHLEDDEPEIEKKTTGEPLEVWGEPGGIVPTRRTSLVVDPPDGHVPLTAQARKTRESRLADRDKPRVFDDPEQFTLTERCLMFGGGPPMLPLPYNHGMQIVQTPDTVLILSEMIHDARIIPLDGRPHLPSTIVRWQGDSRGRWDGDTLVVETTNFTNRTRVMGPTGGMRLVERFSRTADDLLLYRFTVENPAQFDRPWTAEFPMRRSTTPIYEYACHEGNYSLASMLRGARAEEK